MTLAYYGIAVPLCALAIYLMFKPKPWSLMDLEPVTLPPERLSLWEAWTEERQLCRVEPMRDYRAIAKREQLSAQMDAARAERRKGRVVELARGRMRA